MLHWHAHLSTFHAVVCEDLKILPSVTSLSLNDMYLRPPECLALLDTFHGVTDLHICGIDFEHYNDYYKFLAGFIALQNLTMRLKQYRTPIDNLAHDSGQGDDDLDGHSMAMSLRSLHLTDDYADWDGGISAIFHWLARQPTVPALQYLYVKDLGSNQSCEKLAVLLPRIAGSLTHLELSISEVFQSYAQFDLNQYINLSVLSRLQIIYLEYAITYYTSSFSHGNDWIYGALSQLGPSVEVIELEIHVQRRFSITSLDWGKIRLVLEDRHLPSLRGFRIHYATSESNSSGVQDLIASQLPEYHLRGILSFHLF